jgi:hypothetical protein
MVATCMASEMRRLAFIASGTKPPAVRATPKTNMPHTLGESDAPEGNVAHGPKPKQHEERYKRMDQHDDVDSSTRGD